MAASEEAPLLPAPAAVSRGPSLVQFLAATVLLTLIGGGGGAFLGLQLASSVEQSVQRKAEAEAESAQVESRYAGSTLLKPLAPIVTNLAYPTDTWVRLEASLVLDESAVADTDLLAGEIGEDILAFLRTVTLPQIEGASGLQHLRDDLDERVAIRSEGRVRELVIQTLVVQ